MTIQCSVPLDMDMDNDDIVCMLFDEQMAFVQKNLALVRMFLHICTFKTPAKRAVMSEQGDADCTFQMRNGVKEIKRSDSNNNYANLDEYFASQLGWNIELLVDDYEFKGCLYELFHLIDENRGLFNQLYHSRKQ